MGGGGGEEKKRKKENGEKKRYTRVSLNKSCNVMFMSVGRFQYQPSFLRVLRCVCEPLPVLAVSTWNCCTTIVRGYSTPFQRHLVRCSEEVASELGGGGGRARVCVCVCAYIIRVSACMW